MREPVLHDVEKYTKAHHRKMRWYKAITCMAALVVFCTTYALILPAVTMSRENPELQAERTMAALGESLTLNIIARPEDSTDTVFYLTAKQDNAGPDLDFDADNVAVVTDLNGQQIQLHREVEEDGTVGYWFTLSGSESEATLTLLCKNGVGKFIKSSSTDEKPTVEDTLSEEDTPSEDSVTISDGNVDPSDPVLLFSDDTTAPMAEPQTQDLGLEENSSEEEQTGTEDIVDEEFSDGTIQEDTIAGEPSEPIWEYQEGNAEAEGSVIFMAGSGATLEEAKEAASGNEENKAHLSWKAESAPSRVDEVIALIDALPASEEVKEHLNDLDEAGDMEAYDSYYKEVSTQVCTAYSFYENLDTELQEKVTNRDRLLELSWLYLTQNLDDQNALTVYQVNCFGSAGAGPVTALAYSASAGKTVMECLGSGSRQFYEWTSIVVEKQKDGLKVTDVDTSGDDKSLNIVPEEGFIIITQSLAPVSVDDYVTIHGFDYKNRDFNTNGLGTVAFSSTVSSESKPEDTKVEQTEIPVSAESHFEDNNISAVFHIEGTAIFSEGKNEESVINEGSETTGEADDPENLSEPLSDDAKSSGEHTLEDEPVHNPSDENLVFTITGLSEEDTEYQALVEYAQKSSREDTFYDLSAMSYTLSYQGQELDISNCNVTAEITPKKTMLKAAEPVYDMEEEIAPEAEVGVVLTALKNGETEPVELDSMVVNADEDPAESDAILTLELDGSNPMLAVAVSQTANPKFQVQYYAYLDVAATSGDDSLDIIDTTGKGLPVNGRNPNIKKIYLTQDSPGSTKYKVSTVSQLTEVYQTHQYEYITAPNLTYFNRLYENGNYAIKEIWILKNGKEKESINRVDWNVYNPAQIHFTNREQSATGNNTVLITDNTVIRLVFDTTKSSYTNAVNFYDYDITDDRVHTAKKGINSTDNYIGSGAKLAFGNDNTDTGLGEEIWNGNRLNKYNGNGYSGCTFGLATGLDNDGKIRYAEGVTVPNLFNDGSANGKTSYDNNQYSLSFERNGDTYTLSSVTGTTSATNLQTFTSRWNWNNTWKIWSNHFWPMDGVYNKDPHTGASEAPGTYKDASENVKKYPESDNGLAHNNMFGMQYAVTFELTKDYSGPLEYYFFGDDDMWVFLDNQLVCDIGGVHSSVGEYVNLWDYISKGSEGVHKLTFFYTERGLSGSTCYMQFTLPSVSSVTPEQNTGQLKVEKKVTGYQAESNETEFQFSIKLTDADGKNLPDDYSYTRYDKNNKEVKKDLIIYDGGSFGLKNGEYIIIKYLPYGTKYTITEEGNLSGYVVSNTVDDEPQTYSVTASGAIVEGKNGTVVYTNDAGYELPKTGGAGTILYTMGGLLLITAAAMLLLYNHIKRRKEGSASS